MNDDRTHIVFGRVLSFGERVHPDKECFLLKSICRYVVVKNDI
jgi:hypothetical protein